MKAHCGIYIITSYWLPILRIISNDSLILFLTAQSRPPIRGTTGTTKGGPPGRPGAGDFQMLMAQPSLDTRVDYHFAIRVFLVAASIVKMR